MAAGEGIPAIWEWSATGDDMRAPHTGADTSGNRIVVYSHCLDGSSGGSHLNGDLDIILTSNADIILLQDTRWLPHQAASAVSRLSQEWSSQGLWTKYWPGAQPRNCRHGVFVAVRAPWHNRVLRDIQDQRDWGRFGGVIIQGASGSVAFVSLYAPTFSDHAADVTWQCAQIQKLKLNMTPWDLCRHDLRVLVIQLQAEGIVCVIAGDTNTTWDLGARLHEPAPATMKHVELWRKWADDLQFENVMRLRQHEPTVTF